ncbi:MAG: hypothetical protein HUJ79_04470 [Firmicutes bacterium]|nr:hypothetical protein [Bacillota bacterium]
MKKNTSNQTTLIDAISAIAFAAITFYLMAIDGGNYLRKIDSLSIFLPTCDFARECLMTAGGPLCWVARWLTQSFYYPWLGATVYCVLLLVMAVLTVKAFKLSWRLFPVALIPPAMTLLSLLKFGYLIISLKTPGFAFLMPVGIICCLLLFWAYSRLQTWWLRLISIILIAVIGYECMGFYGLLATAMCVVAELCKAFGERKEPIWQGVLNAFVALVLIAAVPKIWFENIGGRLIDEKIYAIQLPLFKDNEQTF